MARHRDVDISGADGIASRRAVPALLILATTTPNAGPRKGIGVFVYMVDSVNPHINNESGFAPDTVKV